MFTLNVLLSACSASRKVSFHILLCFPLCLRHSEDDKDGSKEADRAKEEVGVVDVEDLYKIHIINNITNTRSNRGPSICAKTFWTTYICVVSPEG